MRILLVVVDNLVSHEKDKRSVLESVIIVFYNNNYMAKWNEGVN